MSGGLFQLAGMFGADPDDNTEELLKKGQIDEEEALLLQGLLGDAPVDPGDDFREYMGSQGGAKGFFGSALNPLITRGLFSDDFNDYRDARASYATDKAIFDARSAGITQYMKDSAGDLQDTKLADLVRRGITSGPEYEAALIEAGGVDKRDLNPYTLASGGVRLDGQNNVVAYNPREIDPTSQERNLAARNDLYAREPKDKNSAEWKAWDQERLFFESAVRANQNVNGVIRSGTGGEVIGDEQEYRDSAAEMTSATEGAKQDVQTGAAMYADAKSGAEEAYTAVQEYDFSLQNANEVLAGLESGKYNTNIARSMMLDYLGLGGIDDGTLLAMGTDEAIQKVQGFNGHTTDFEYGQAFNAAFARLRNNTDVNIGVMTDVIKGLENARMNAQNAYQSNVYDASNAARSTVEKRWTERMNGRNQEAYPKAPKIGFEREGRRYMGGDPSDIRNWLEMTE